MGELRNGFKRLAFNGFLTRWDGSGLVAAWRGHLLSGEWCLSMLVDPQCYCKETCCGKWEGWGPLDHRGKEEELQWLSMQLARRMITITKRSSGSELCWSLISLSVEQSKIFI